MVLMTFGNMILLTHYRTYVTGKITNDRVLVSIGCLAGLSFGLSRYIHLLCRLLWELMVYKFKFRSVARCLTVLNILLYTPINWTMESEKGYGFIVILSAAVLSGICTAS